MSQSALWVHFVHHHMRGTIVVLEEGNHPLPLCPKFDIFVSCEALNGSHSDMAMGAKGVEPKLRRWG